MERAGSLQRGGIATPRRRVLLSSGALLVVWALAAATARAQTAAVPPPASAGAPRLEIDGPMDSKIRFELYERLRGEFVDWFATANPGPTPRFRYNFIGNKLQLGLRVTRAPWELFVQFQDSTLGDVPSGAVGVGSIYFANTHSSTQNGAFLRSGYLATSQLFGVEGLSIKGGRQLYSNAMEAPVKHPSLRWLQVNRFSQRLIGPFDYTHVGRSFDGGVVGWTSPKISFTGFGFRPTYGGYEVDANRELDIDLAGGAISLPDSPELGATFAQLVWIYYHDYRDVTYVDNRPLAVRQAATGRSATLHTIGANAAHVFDGVGPGAIDAVAYGFGQLGDYQGQSDGAWAYGFEAGYRFTETWARPWLRVGIDSASGDPDPNDDEHQTFFQMLPTAWLYAQFPFYNMMNNQDVFAQAILEPDPRVSLRLDFHWLRVSSSRDLAYFGGGATKNDFFGFGGVSAAGRYELAYLVHGMLTLRPASWFTVNAFYAHAFGQGVIQANFTGKQGNYGYLEGIVAF
ncbi:MAG TPA: alginate export family protein [Candidatus Binatia bacterium]|nr:alginate export family protein [Candidatus Binatia bacterium]